MNFYNKTFLSKPELSLKLEGKINSLDLFRVESAYDMSQDIYRDKKRRDGTPYFFHLSRVGKILLDELHLFDPDLLSAAFLHDIIEDFPTMNREVLAENFGHYTAGMIQILTKDIHEKDPIKILQIENEYIERIRIANDDIKIIRFAAKLDNMRCLGFSLKKNPMNYILEINNFYLPMLSATTNESLVYLRKNIQLEQNKFLG